MNLIVNKLKEKANGEKPRYNKSTVFLLPMLPECRSFLDTNNMKLLVNVYFHTENDLNYNKSYKDRIYIVFENNKEFSSDENINKIKVMNMSQ